MENWTVELTEGDNNSKKHLPRRLTLTNIICYSNGATQLFAQLAGTVEYTDCFSAKG